MEKQNSVNEIQACIGSLDEMLARTKLLKAEMEEWRKNSSQSCPATGENAISFAELRQLNLLCKKALENCSPDLAEQWYVSPPESMAGPEDIETILNEQRMVLNHALVRLGCKEVKEASGAKAPEDKEIVLLKPSFFGMGIDLKALWSKLSNKIFK